MTMFDGQPTIQFMTDAQLTESAIPVSLLLPIWHLPVPIIHTLTFFVFKNNVSIITLSHANLVFPAPSGPFVIIDGEALAIRGSPINITNVINGCDGTIYFVDKVPLPCNLLNKTMILPTPIPKLNATLATIPIVNVSAVAPPVKNTSNVTVVAAPAKSAAVAMTPVFSSAVAAVMLVLMLL